MEKTFVVEQQDLFKSISIAITAVNTNHILPILRCFLITVDGISSTLTVTGADLETNIESTCIANANEAIEFAVPAKMLLDVVKVLKGKLTINVSDTLIVITTATGQYKIGIDDAADYPETQILDESIMPNVVSAHELLHLGTQCLTTVSSDELRPAMTGILIEKEGNDLILTATDAHRLISGRISIEDDGCDIKSIVPKKVFVALKGAITAANINVDILASSNNVVFMFGNTKITGRLIDAHYPDYRVVIPTSNNISMKCNTKEFATAIKNAIICTDKITNRVVLTLGEKCNIKGEDVAFGNLSIQNIEAECSETLTIGFNGKFLLEMLLGISTINVEMQFKTASNAALILDDDDIHITRLIMPITLQ